VPPPAPPYDYDASAFARFAELPVDQSLWAVGRVRAYESSRAVDLGLPLGILSIPRLRLEVPVWPGADPLTLDRGLGHIPGTPPPGVVGNVGIAGHRDGYFRVLKDVVEGDEILLETLAGRERFVVDLVLIVRPEDVWVLEPTAEPSLTLVTCYPFYFLGKAPQRYIVRATRFGPTPPTTGTDTLMASKSKLPDDIDKNRHSSSSSASGSARP
jgi:sortase A